MDIKIQKIMLNAGYQTINALARKLEIDNALLCSILNGARRGYKHRPRIARALRVKEEEIFGASRRAKDIKRAS